MSGRYVVNETDRNRISSSTSRSGPHLRNYENNKRLDQSLVMIIDSGDENVSGNEDVHVRELRRMFDACDHDGDGALTATGLERLCGELRLDDHKEYIISQLLPNSGHATISFNTFKRKFIQLLPGLVDFSSATEKTKTRTAAPSPLPSGRGNLRLSGGNIDLGSDGSHSRSLTANPNRHQRHEYANSSQRPSTAASRKKLAIGVGGVCGSMATGDGPMVATDEDTSNDIQSEFSDDERRHRPRDANSRMYSRSTNSSNPASRRLSMIHHASQETRPDAIIVPSVVIEPPSPANAVITASDVEQILTGLGLADRGYLGRYEFRILCQHLGLTGLSPSELNGLFNQLDKDSDGRIAVDDFLQVCPPTQSSSCLSSADGERARDSTRDQHDRSFSPVPHKSGTWKTNRCSTPTDNANQSGANLIANESMSICIPPAIRSGTKVTEKMRNLRMEPVTLLASLDECRTGHAKRDTVLTYWDNLGIEDGCGILKKLGFSERQRWIDLKELSAAMDQELCETVEHESSLLAAVLTLKAEICFLKESFDESREQAAHYMRELQQLNQRNAILVEEMDQSQQNLELRAQVQFRELEEKHQSRISHLEGKYREERDQWQVEMKQKEEVLHKLEQAETSLHSRLRQLEKENTKLRTEVDDLTQMMKDVEDLNRDLRQALKEATTFKKNQTQWCNEQMSSISGQVWTQSNRNCLNSGEVPTESTNGLVFQRSTGSAKSTVAEANPGCCRCASTSSTPAKKRIRYTPPSTSALLKRRRLQLHQQHGSNRRNSNRPLDSSEFESEPEPIIFRPKFKRPLKKRERLALIANRDANLRVEYDNGNTLYTAAPLGTPSSTEDDHKDTGLGGLVVGNDLAGSRFTYYPSGGVAVNGAGGNWDKQNQHLALIERKLSDERKYYAQELKVEIAAMEEEHARESRRITERFEREKEQMRRDYKREIDALLHANASEKRSALETQETELRKQFEAQRRDAEIKWATERNVMERRFAEEKMEMMERLQNDFEDELSRLRRSSSNRSPESSSSPVITMENRLRFEQTLQENMQLNARLDALLNELRTVNEALNLERERAGKMEERIGELQKQITLGQKNYDELSRENATLSEERGRLKSDLHDVSMEFSILQQRAMELEQQQQRLQETSRISSSDVDVQTDRSLLVPVKDESVQLESSPLDDNVSQSALSTCERCRRALVNGVNELELLLQSGESGFEEEMVVDEHDSDPVRVRNICGKLRSRLTKAQEKFEEIRKSLLKEGPCFNQDSEFSAPSRPHSAPNLATTCRETQTDDEDEMEDVNERCLWDVQPGNTIIGDVEGDDLIEDHELDTSLTSSTVMAEVTGRLRDENFLLRARLFEQKRLTGQLTDRLQRQMHDTVKVSQVAQKLFARLNSIDKDQTKKQRVL